MRFPSWLTWYKKPEYRDFREYATAVRVGKRQLSPDGRGKTAVPRKLRLERILENRTCSPMSLYDFYMYLKYIEFSAENLEFYVWYRNYARTYDHTATSEEQEPWSKDDITLTTTEHREPPSPDESMAEFSLEAEVARETLEHIAGLLNAGPACQPGAPCKAPSFSTEKSASSSDAIVQTPDRNTPAGHRAELNAIIKTYLVPNAEKELNIPPSMRDQALLALQTSDDPIHLAPIADHVYQLLRNCSHRNFVRLGVSNGTYETICMATGLGIVLTLAGFLLMFLLAFYPHRGYHTRWDAFAPWPLWWLGVSLICSGLRGSCFFLLLFSVRQRLPWERFDDNASVLSNASGLKSVLRFASRLMIVDRKLKVQDVHLRRLQNKIVMQSLIAGAVCANAGVLVFIFLPIWRQTV